MTDQERAREWCPDVELFRKKMMDRFSDRLSMEEIAEFSYEIAAYAAASERRGRDEMRQACIDAVDDLLADTNAISPRSVVKVIEAIHAIRREGK